MTSAEQAATNNDDSYETLRLQRARGEFERLRARVDRIRSDYLELQEQRRERDRWVEDEAARQARAELAERALRQERNAQRARLSAAAEIRRDEQGEPGLAQPPRGVAALVDTVQGLFQELPGVVSDRVQLLSLEVRQASGAIAMVVVMAVIALIGGATAWLAFWVAVGLAIASFGLHWGWAVGAVFALNLLIVVIALLMAKSRASGIGLPATMRHLATTRESLQHPESVAAEAAVAQAVEAATDGELPQGARA